MFPAGRPGTDIHLSDNDRQNGTAADTLLHTVLQRLSLIHIWKELDGIVAFPVCVCDGLPGADLVKIPGNFQCDLQMLPVIDGHLEGNKRLRGIRTRGGSQGNTVQRRQPGIVQGQDRAEGCSRLFIICCAVCRRHSRGRRCV